jgi:hypothetical protein
MKQESNTAQILMATCRAMMVAIVLVSWGFVGTLKAQTTIFSENFDGAWPNSWYVGNDGGITTQMWGDNSYRYYSGGYSGFCADSGSNSANGYANNLHTYMEKRAVSLAGYTSATLTFWYYINSEATYDKLTVNVRSQSGSWAELWAISGNSSGWVQKTISLSSYLGQTGLYVQFRFDSDATVNVAGGGAWIDNISLTATAGSPDLTLQTGDLDKTSGFPGDTLNATLTVKNQGLAAAGATSYVYYYC